MPLLRDGQVDGVFGLMHPEPGAFTPREIELLKTFADQAVIAIENARLFDEVQARTRDLNEVAAAADRHRRRAEGHQPVGVRSEVATSTTLEARGRTLPRAPRDASAREMARCFRLIASVRPPEPFERQARESPDTRFATRWHSSAGWLGEGTSRISPTHWPIPSISTGEPREYGGYRALIGVPLLREDELVGVFALGRPSPDLSLTGQIELAQTFADQAVIAIENARLFDEVQARTRDLTEALQQQTATADVLKVISRSAFDLADGARRRFAESARELCGASFVTLFVRDGDDNAA